MRKTIGLSLVGKEGYRERISNNIFYLGKRGYRKEIESFPIHGKAKLHLYR